jgi:hypothetical protein
MHDFTPIENFLQRARGLGGSRSKELRLSLEEATTLAINVGELLVKLAKAEQAEPEETIELVVSGGGFISN